MSFSDSRVTYHVQERLVLAKLVDLTTKTVRDVTWTGLVVEDLGKFVHCPKHVSELVFYLLRIHLLEWTFTKTNSQFLPRHEMFTLKCSLERPSHITFLTYIIFAGMALSKSQKLKQTDKTTFWCRARASFIERVTRFLKARRHK